MAKLKVGDVYTTNAEIYIFDRTNGKPTGEQESYEPFINNCLVRKEEITKFLKDNYPEDLV